MLNLVLFGPPGAGKGTQSELLIKKYELKHLSTGDILRGEIAAQTELGMKAKQLMDKGMLVGDDVVIGMIRNLLKEHSGAKGFIFDGFPRTNEQARALDELMMEVGSEITQMVALDVPEDELIVRLLARGKDSGRADDSNPEIIKNRIKQYHLKTAPVADYYNNQGKYHTISGIGTVEEIFSRICGQIDAVAK